MRRCRVGLFGLFGLLVACGEQTGLHLTWDLRYRSEPARCRDIGRAATVEVTDDYGLGPSITSFECDDHEAI